jgi:hypothetical protein
MNKREQAWELLDKCVALEQAAIIKNGEENSSYRTIQVNDIELHSAISSFLDFCITFCDTEYDEKNEETYKNEVKTLFTENSRINIGFHGKTYEENKAIKMSDFIFPIWATKIAAMSMSTNISYNSHWPVFAIRYAKFVL